ncbi:MAG TPA: pilus assembly protein TadG-related protein, partial [Roseiflexaceae bacterium]|nr:pilus assembly protein TadG-related protein [Roseiflexaceae bacterium]
MLNTALHRSSGQSLVTLAVFAFLLFLTMGLAIDGGLIYAQRRVMQNTADAACLTAANRMALGKTNVEATTAAQDIVKDNLGATPGSGANAPGTLAYVSYTELYGNGTNTGTGISLVRGIEVNGPDVRVALQSPASTTFMRIAGIATYTVAARAHCNATAGAGSVPFAVARWRGFDSTGKLDTDGLSTDKTLPQNGKKGQMTVHDILRREGSNVITQWPGWGSATYPGDPDAATDLYSSPDSAVIATDATPGEETVLAGNEARPNTGGNSFTGPIVLDYRQTTYPQPLFYNGLTPDSALPVYKDYATKYILGEYPGPSVIPG